MHGMREGEDGDARARGMPGRGGWVEDRVGCRALDPQRKKLPGAGTGPPADWGFEKQLPFNKCEQKFGPIFKVMSYAENMFLRTRGTGPSWHLAFGRVYK